MAQNNTSSLQFKQIWFDLELYQIDTFDYPAEYEHKVNSLSANSKSVILATTQSLRRPATGAEC